jgi:hypothetical protein
MHEADSAVDAVDMFRRRAWQAEAEAQRTSDGLAQQIFILVAMTWREIALEAARARAGERDN